MKMGSPPREPTEEHTKKMNEFLAEQRDWYAWCPKCKTKLSGTPAELKAGCPECKDGK